MNVTLHNNIVVVLQKKRNQVLKDKSIHPRWPQTYFTGQITELDYWIKESNNLTTKEIVQGMIRRRDRLMCKDIPLRKGRLDNNRLFADIRLLNNLIAELTNKK